MSSVMVQINTSVRGCHDVEWQSSFAAATRGEKNKKKKAKHKNLVAVICLVQLNRLYSSKPPTIKQSYILFKPVTSLQTTGKQS